MTWTKRQLVDEAYTELAMAGYVFDISPEELQSGLRRLDAMMASWAAKGLQLPYNFGGDPTEAALDQPSGLPLTATEAAYLNLAVRIAAGKGKAVSPTTLATATAAYDALMSRLAHEQVQPVQLRAGVPLGAGNRGLRAVYITTPTTEPLQIADDGGLQFNGS